MMYADAKQECEALAHRQLTASVRRAGKQSQKSPKRPLAAGLAGR